MKLLSNGGRLVEDSSELPDLRNARDLFADFETTSCDYDEIGLDSLNPWHHCWALGLAVTADDVQGAWYVPLRHRDGARNIDLDAARAWWADTLGTAKRWTNHNVKYDAHVSANDMGYAPDWPEQELFDTVTHAKIIHSDRGYGRGTYALDSLSADWLGEDISRFSEEIDRWRRRGRSMCRDFGCVPREPMAEYACQDVITNRRLARYVVQMRHPDCDRIARIETDLTSVLYRMERVGMRVIPIELMQVELELSMRMLQLDAELAELCGHSVNPSSNDQLYDLFINQYGLPILGWTDEDEEGRPCGNASFDKEALALYQRHPLAPHRVVDLIIEARSISQTLSLFVKPYQSLLGHDGRLHPDVNQCVRTGRMSMRAPNMQQLSKVAKRLIHPADGSAFLSADQSQIEFRVIVHYIENARCTEAYLRDPDTDFHVWVAENCGMKRRPAKTMNFMMGYGGGKKKAVRAMAMNSDVVGGMVEVIDKMVADGRIVEQQREATFDAMCVSKGERVYDDYHRALPELKPTSRRATAVCYDRGYVRNLHGRHRHLPQAHSHKAFNSLCQGEAADIQKERTVALARATLKTGLELVGNVHDEVVLEGPAELLADPRTQKTVAWILETPDIPLRVPLRTSVGYSEKHWAEASTDTKDGGASRPMYYDPSTIDKENPLCFLQSSSTSVFR